MPENDARAISEALGGGRWLRCYGTAFCPAHHNTRTPALVISNATDGRLLAYCHNGCDFTADILPALRDLGLVSGGGAGKAWPRLDPEAVERRRREDEAAARKRAEAAQRIWNEGQPAAGSPVESYLRGRGITADLPDGLTALRGGSKATANSTARRSPRWSPTLATDSTGRCMSRTRRISIRAGRSTICATGWNRPASPSSPRAVVPMA